MVRICEMMTLFCKFFSINGHLGYIMFSKELNISNKLEYEWIEIYYVFDCDEMKSVFI